MGWDFGFAGGFWSEYWTQKYTASQFKSICEYTETSFSTAYSNLTAGVLKDLKEIKTVAEESGNTGNYFVAEALSIYTWQILTDVWGVSLIPKPCKVRRVLFLPSSMREKRFMPT